MTPVQRPLNHTTARPRGVREVPIAPSAIPRVTSGQHHTNGVAPPTPSPSQHSNVSRSPAAPVPVTTGTTHLTTPRPASSQPAPNQQVQRLESLLREKDVRINFLERQLRDARFGPTTRASKRGSPTAPASQAEADAVRRFYNEALKIAGQDFTACLECGVGFFAQFRGAPENPMERALILKCKKCDAEQCRWR
ncbi:hypothetical protein K461DRAFT_276785 [Myriangium duriaei CBS 260.36]|uniref:Uncharacterized protein n=1 Tax=Myriangium duriaei CBS 260.36 TaxID=1168546 RepID=A0A9P4J7F5_9PEZI|nr:hypothetical protein K461DRAFT_276785 [Myriangium duriaei CBS 260.36]